MSTIKVDSVKSSLAGVAPVIRDLNDVEVSQGCTAWVNFNGTGVVAIRDSFNVSGITDNGVGDYTVNFATPMANANYIGAGNASHSSINIGAINNLKLIGRTLNSARILGNYTNTIVTTAYDRPLNDFVFFGGK